MTVFPQNSEPYAVVFDLEFTAWADSMATRWMRPGDYPEIIQIGAVKVDRAFVEIAAFERLIRPRLNPVLSTYIEELTGITNADVQARGVDLAEGYRDFLAFTAGLPIIAFGRDDLVFADNFRLYGLTDRFTVPPYVNAVPWMADQGIDLRGLHACDTAAAVGIAFVGHKHNGLDDARSVAASLRILIARGATPPAPR